jgi:quercetin dioxygenase-like cupin family protein
MSEVKTVQKDGITYALFVCGRPHVDGAKFFTKQTDEFQVGVFTRPKGYEVKAHRHPENEQAIRHCTEVLYIEEGKVEVTVFDDKWNEIGKQVLTAGDFLIFFCGGHSLTMLEPTRLLEVKQGPYPGDDKAKTFRPAA